MNYFIDADLGKTITGIEQAQFNRLKLFKKNHIPAKLVYMQYRSQLHAYMEKFGVKGEGYSMYDYFQRATQEFSRTFDWQYYWQDVCGYTLQYSDKYNDIRVLADNEVLLYAGFFDSTYLKVNYISYFDQDHHRVRTDFYDSRGFLSRSQFLAENGLVHSEFYYDPQENIRIIRQNLVTEKTVYLRNITLKNYHGRDIYLGSEEELQTFFFNELYQSGDVLYSDRSGNFAKAMEKTAPDVQIVAVLHSAHVRPKESVLTGTLKRGVYDYVLTHPQHLSGIVCSTKQQRRDLLARFRNLPTVTAIPVGMVERQRVNIKKRNFHRIVCVARYAQEKQLMHQVKAIERLVPEFPDVELNLIGSGSAVENEIRQYIAKHHLEKNVLIRGFHQDLSSEYKKSSLFLQTSVEEGFSLSTLEALSYHVPVIGYNINYGPSEMIVDGKNGFLVPADDQEALYQKIRQYLKNPKMQKKFMKNCDATIQKFMSTKIQKKWKRLSADLLMK